MFAGYVQFICCVYFKWSIGKVDIKEYEEEYEAAMVKKENN